MGAAMATEIPPFKPFDTVPFPEDEPPITLRQAEGPVLDLETVIEELHDSEINAGLQTFHPDGLRVWIGDQLNGLHASAHIVPGDPAWGQDGVAARWLHQTAIRLFPDSDYAKQTACGTSTATAS
jgi:hypothetical protein